MLILTRVSVVGTADQFGLCPRAGHSVHEYWSGDSVPVAREKDTSGDKIYFYLNNILYTFIIVTVLKYAQAALVLPY